MYSYNLSSNFVELWKSVYINIILLCVFMIDKMLAAKLGAA